MFNNPYSDVFEGADGMKIAAVILIGGSNKGTRFRPISFDTPKHLFPIAGKSIVEHQLKCLQNVNGLEKVFILGSYKNSKELFNFPESTETRIEIEFVYEDELLGTAGSLYFLYKNSNISYYQCVIMSYCDIVCDYPFQEMVAYFSELNTKNACAHCILETKTIKDATPCFGTFIFDETTNEIVHYLEKSASFISLSINGGIGVFKATIFDVIDHVYRTKNYEGPLDMGLHIYEKLISDHSFYAFEFKKPWIAVKSPNDALHAQRLLLSLDCIKENNYVDCHITGNVYVHPQASIDPSASIGPNVSIEAGCIVKNGVRISNSIILSGSIIHENSYITDTIIGLNCSIKPWCRIQGAFNNDYFEYFKRNKDNDSYFTTSGHFNPCVTVLGNNVSVNQGVMIYNSIILQHKEITVNCKGVIIL